jgi:hypothetical protein
MDSLPTLGGPKERERIKRVHYPAFTSSEVHGGRIEWYPIPVGPRPKLTARSVQFAGDTVVSKAKGEHTILVWQIDSFNSDLPPPAEQANRLAPHAGTASAFGGQFQRLQTLALPGGGNADLLASGSLGGGHFAVAGRGEPMVVYADVRGVYRWNLAAAAEAEAAAAPRDCFAGVGADGGAAAKALTVDAPWAWEAPVRVAVGNGGMYVALGMREGLLCVLLSRGWIG